jgi:methylenetetrahydrofolate dehydrogenase (NADP+) / methenyltetrahydrofolate cyclohydrolase
MKEINGKKIAAKKLLTLKDQIDDMNLQPAVAVILIGDDAPSHLYVKLKERSAKEIGIELRKYVFDAHATQREIETSVDFLNSDPDTHGIIVQLPLPEKFDTAKIIGAIDPQKDVDGFHGVNQELFLRGQEILYPVFPGAIMDLLDSCGVDVKNKKSVVVGKSDVFDRIMTRALEKKGMRSIFIPFLEKRSFSNKEQEIIHQADVIVTACGIPGIISCDIVRDGAIIIDGGISRRDGKTYGDVDMKKCEDRNIFISPVPGGVGPMTIARLMENVVILAKKQSE